jgi:hypothetical protein
MTFPKVKEHRGARGKKQPWTSKESYPSARAAEFAIAAYNDMGRDLLIPDTSVIIEYVTEATHQDGEEYWLNFPTLSDALTDFRIYRAQLEDLK